MKLKDCKYFFHDFWGSQFHLGLDEIITESSMKDLLLPWLDKSQKARSIEEANLIIYSCFGDKNISERLLHDIKCKNNAIIIHWTGEARIIDFPFTDLILGSDKQDHTRHFYSLLGLLYLKHLREIYKSPIFCSIKSICERKFCTTFCSYLTSQRIQVIEAILSYKLVDRFGAAFGTRRNGYYWEPGYREFLSYYKFVICCENTFREGYNTEKIINPLLAGSIPIYWGSPSVFNFVNGKRVLYLLQDLSNLPEIVERIKILDEDDNLFTEMLNQPSFILDDLDELEREVEGTYYNNSQIIKSYIENFNPPSSSSNERSGELSWNVNKFDLPILLINLDRSEDRLELMKEQFQKHKIEFERIKGIDGLKLFDKAEGDINFEIDGPINENKNGAIGCTLSHLKAIKHAYDKLYDTVIIMEDDTDLSLIDRWPSSFSYRRVVERAPMDWDIIQMYTSNMNMIPQLYAKDSVDQYVKRTDDYWSTGTYIINRTGMEKILRKYYDVNRKCFHLSGFVTADLLIYRDLFCYIYTRPTVCTNNYRFISLISPKHDEHGIASSKFIHAYYYDTPE